LRLFGRVCHGGNETGVVEEVTGDGECRRVPQAVDFGNCRRVLAGDDRLVFGSSPLLSFVIVGSLY